MQTGVEQCDDANGNNGDGCLNTCVAASCGDGFVQIGVEACDDGNGSNTDACLNTCDVASCGDGFVQGGVEQCDDGNVAPNDGCSTICTLEQSSLGDFVWLDLNQDGIQDPGENGIPGVTCNLLDGAGNPVSSTVTGTAGDYLFTGLVPGSYQVQFVAPAGYTASPSNVGGDDSIDSDANAVIGLTSVVSLLASQSNLSLDAGFHQCGNGSVDTGEQCDDGNLVSGDGCSSLCQVENGSIGDTVWFDVDRDGVQDPGEAGIPGVTVNLYDGQGNLVGTTVTDGNGDFVFNDVPPGDYTVEFVPPAGYDFTDVDQGGDDTTDSDADPFTGITGTVTVLPGEQVDHVDAGLHQCGNGSLEVGEQCDDGNQVSGDGCDDLCQFEDGSIGDTVWFDEDRDGVQNPGEPGVPGVIINVYNGQGNLSATVVTNVNGNYGVPNLPPGSYTVQFLPPAGYDFTDPNQGGDDTTDSDADPVSGFTGIVSVSPGVANTTVDAGLHQCGNGTVDAGEQCDDGNQVGGDGCSATCTLDPGSIGDFVWLDANRDGVQDLNEPGIPGVAVLLFDDAGNVLASDTTDGQGAYLFSGLPAGTYRVQFVLPLGYFPTLADVGNDSSDSDADPATGRTTLFSLAPGQAITTIDAGFHQCGDGTVDTGEQCDDGNTVSGDGCTECVLDGSSIGDFVWYDEDRDGVQDPGEPGIPSVTVNLYDGGGNLVASTTTGPNGDYSFTGLTPGIYQVEVVPPPAGFGYTSQGQGGDSALDSDIGPTGRSTPITLGAGEVNNDVDSGLHSCGNGVVDAGETCDDGNQTAGDGCDEFCQLGSALLGNFVWYDSNRNGIQDPGENGLIGFTVNLLDGAGNPIASTGTDIAGGYSFQNLSPGIYQVEFPVPVGAFLTLRDVGLDDTVDSDPDPVTFRTPLVTLAAGEANLTLDAGIHQCGNAIVDFGEQCDDGNQASGDGCSAQCLIEGATAELGDYAWYDSDRDGTQSAGESGLGNVTVLLYDAAGNLIGMTLTDGFGAYLFTNVTPGNYYLQFLSPAGMFPTLNDVAGDMVDSDMDPLTERTQIFTVNAGDSLLDLDAGFNFCGNGVTDPQEECDDGNAIN